jgi:hypothetical protein
MKKQSCKDSFDKLLIEEQKRFEEENWLRATLRSIIGY